MQPLLHLHWAHCCSRTMNSTCRNLGGTVDPMMIFACVSGYSYVLACQGVGGFDLRTFGTGWPPDPYTCTKCSLLDPGRGSGRSAALRFWRLHMTDDLVAVSWAKWRSAGDFVAAAQTAIDAVDSPQQRADIQSSLVPTPLSLLFKGSDFCKNAVHIACFSLRWFLRGAGSTAHRCGVRG